MRTAPAGNIFGQILSGNIASHGVYSDDHVYAFLDIFPQAPGHTLVVPRAYSENLFDADAAEVEATLAAVRKLAPAVQRATGAPGVTIISNAGKDAGQMIEYFHWHIVPRRVGDSVSLQQLGDGVSENELAAMAAKIKNELEAGAG